jgi:hypothetical protein
VRIRNPLVVHIPLLMLRVLVLLLLVGRPTEMRVSTTTVMRLLLTCGEIHVGTYFMLPRNQNTLQ